MVMTHGNTATPRTSRLDSPRFVIGSLLAGCVCVAVLAVAAVYALGWFVPQVAGQFFALNDRAPAYIKDVVAYKEGDWFVLYMVLADETGAMTTTDGHLQVTITSGTLDVHTLGVALKKSDFQRATVGRGAFAHDVVMYMIGRIPYSQFRYAVTGPFGTVKMNCMCGPTLPMLVGQTSVVF
jgi:hypothetical protein